MPRRGPEAFRPPAHEQAPIELARTPTPVSSGTVAPAQPGAPVPGAQPRKPLRYRRPSTSWVVVIVLALAAVGAYTVTKRVARNLHAVATAPEPAPGPPVYRPLPRDDGVLIDIDVSPAQARLLLDGMPLPSRPLRLPRGATPHRLTATADGYEPGAVDLVPDEAKTIKVRLVRAK